MRNSEKTFRASGPFMTSLMLIAYFGVYGAVQAIAFNRLYLNTYNQEDQKMQCSLEMPSADGETLHT